MAPLRRSVSRTDATVPGLWGRTETMTMDRCQTFRRPTGRAWRGLAATLALALVAVGQSGCTVSPIYHGVVPFPFWLVIPVPQIIGDNIQERIEKDYSQVPIMPPVREDSPVFCQDPPSEYDVIRAMKKPSRWGKIPFLYEKQYNNIEIVVEKIVDTIDDCRVYPLVGPAQLHHCHYKVTVYYDRFRRMNYPFAWEVKDKDVEVIYIDKDHLHICTSSEMEDNPESYRDIYGAY